METNGKRRKKEQIIESKTSLIFKDLTNKKVVVKSF